ncbi:MAG: Gfo/Idh/MocA family oxidoreductase [Phycisphaerae bacterium]|nr:Gfo/Idh/MocA family oxidoreductase [Phycisphaerae bacterium]
MSQDRIKVGLLGVDGCGANLLDALRACPLIDVIALADRDRDLAYARAAELGIEGYDDYRSLVVEQPLNALFVAAPPFACFEQLKLAASRGIHVWRETPLARSVAEAAELIHAFDAAGVRLAVARQWHFTCRHADLADVEDLIGRPYSARGLATEARLDPLRWRGDTERAGGGAIIDRGYEAMDAIVQRLGLPDEVQTTTARRTGTQPYDTEDVGVVALRYLNGAMASLVAHRRAGPETWSVTFDGPNGNLVIDPPTVTLRDPDGTDLQAWRADFDSPYAPQIEAFARAVLTDAKTYPSPAAEHLATVAVIETGYLSARTGEPESVSQLYHMNDLPIPRPPAPSEEQEELQQPIE